MFGKALWICAPAYNGRISRFVKKITLPAPASRALLRIVGLGWYISYINGVRTDEEYFKPLVSDYGNRAFSGVSFYRPKSGVKRIYYNEFDVTALLHAGQNELSADLFGGWYAHREKSQEGDFSYGDPCLIFRLEVQTGGERMDFCSDGSTEVWEMPASATIFRGESIDFCSRPCPVGAAQPAPPPCGVLCKAPVPCDRIAAEHFPRLIKEGEGTKILDFGVNHSGFLRGTLRGRRGSKVRIVYAEQLDSAGNIDHTSTSWGTQIQQDEYILSGGEDEIGTQGTYHGFRYAAVSAPPGTQMSLRSEEINAALPRAGRFKSSEPAVDWIVKAFARTMLSNMHGGVPTDCPHRERRGFTGDGQVTAAASMYLFDAESFYRKWMQDVFDSQQENGYVPHTAPYSGGGGGYGWGYAVCRIPEVLFGFTGDAGIVREAFPHIERWVRYMNTKHGGTFLLSREEDSWSLGDWFCADSIRIDPVFVCTCFYLMSVRTLISFGEILGESCAPWREVEQNIVRELRAHFYDRQTGSFAGGEQGADALALELGLAPKGEEARVRHSLVLRYKKLGYADTGIFCLVPLLRQLTKCGEADLVFRMLTRTEYPSFGYMRRMGATTLWECWSQKISPTFRLADGALREGYPVSHNHPMFGSVCAFLFEEVGGLSLERYGAARIVRIRPRFFRQIRACSVSRCLKEGEVSVSYLFEKGVLRLKITLPSGVKGEVELPFGERRSFVLEEGEHLIEEEEKYAGVAAR